MKQWKNCSEFLPVIILRFEMVLFLLLYPAIKGISVVSVIWMLLQRLGQGAAGEGRGNAEIEGGTLENPEGAGGFSLLQLVEVIVHLLPSLPPFDLS